MAEKLSQAEIDALLSAAFSGQAQLSKPKEEAPKYRKYDFKSPRKFTKDRLKMLNGIFDSYSRSLNTRINGLLPVRWSAVLSRSSVTMNSPML